MHDTTETITAHNASVTGWRRPCHRLDLWQRRREGQRSKWPVSVVVIGERFKDPLKVWLVQNQQPVKTFRPNGPHEPLGATNADARVRAFRSRAGCVADSTVTADPRLLATFHSKAGRWQIGAGTYRVALGKPAVDLMSTTDMPLSARSFGR